MVVIREKAIADQWKEDNGPTEYDISDCNGGTGVSVFAAVWMHKNEKARHSVWLLFSFHIFLWVSYLKRAKKKKQNCWDNMLFLQGHQLFHTLTNECQCWFTLIVHIKTEQRCCKGGAVVSTLATIWGEDVQASSCNQEQRRRLDLSDHLCSQISLNVRYLCHRPICAPSREPVLHLRPCWRWSSRPCLNLEENSEGKHLQDGNSFPTTVYYHAHVLAPSPGQMLICSSNNTQLQACGRINLPAQFSLVWLYL